MAAQTRYQAEWVESLGDQPPLREDFDPDAVERGRKDFADQQAAIDWAHDHDLFYEGKVYITKLVLIDFDDGYGPEPCWEDVATIYISEDGTIDIDNFRGDLGSSPRTKT